MVVKVKHNCVIPTMASCVNTEVTPNTQSSLIAQDCLSQEEVNQDIYTQLGDINSKNNLSELGCLTYTLVDGELFIKNALLKMEEEICKLKTEVDLLKAAN